jgi:hypothetical protein
MTPTPDPAQTNVFTTSREQSRLRSDLADNACSGHPAATRVASAILRLRVADPRTLASAPRMSWSCLDDVRAPDAC